MFHVKHPRWEEGGCFSSLLYFREANHLFSRSIQTIFQGADRPQGSFIQCASEMTLGFPMDKRYRFVEIHTLIRVCIFLKKI